MKMLRRLARDQQGVAVMEFALLSSLFLMFALMSLDAGLFLMKRSQLSNALDSAGLAAFSQREAVNYSGIPAFVRQASRLSGATVTVGCNGGGNNCSNTSRSCACLSKTGTYVATTCGNVCTGAVTASSTAGYYMTIDASADYTPIILPNKAFANASTTQKITVRLQ